MIPGTAFGRDVLSTNISGEIITSVSQPRKDTLESVQSKSKKVQKHNLFKCFKSASVHLFQRSKFSYFILPGWLTYHIFLLTEKLIVIWICKLVHTFQSLDWWKLSFTLVPTFELNCYLK